MKNYRTFLLLTLSTFILTACSNSDLNTAQNNVAKEDSKVVDLYKVTPEGAEEKLGTIALSADENGLALQVNASGLTAGEHGFHIHENPNCGPTEKDGAIVPGGAAGSHFDPHNTGVHEGPEGDGHLGDLPKLIVAEDGTVKANVIAPRITSLETIKNTSFMVHAKGDNYSDHPASLGGGGARMACGVFK